MGEEQLYVSPVASSRANNWYQANKYSIRNSQYEINSNSTPDKNSNANYFFVSLRSGMTIKVLKEYYEIGKSIKDSEYIYELTDNWDGEGSEGYDYDTWKLAVNFLINDFVDILCSRITLKNIAPVIGPGPEGSVDLFWKNEKFHLLINFPKGGTELPTFYGNDYKKVELQGELISPSIIAPLFNLF